jgi:hypothetical protein
MGGRGVGLVALCLVLGVALFAAPAGAATFSNPTPMNTPGSGGGVATPYPSTISVSGLAGTTVKVLDVLLTGPEEARCSTPTSASPVASSRT